MAIMDLWRIGSPSSTWVDTMSELNATPPVNAPCTCSVPQGLPVDPDLGLRICLILITITNAMVNTGSESISSGKTGVTIERSNTSPHTQNAHAHAHAHPAVLSTRWTSSAAGCLAVLSVARMPPKRGHCCSQIQLKPRHRTPEDRGSGLAARRRWVARNAGHQRRIPNPWPQVEWF